MESTNPLGTTTFQQPQVQSTISNKPRPRRKHSRRHNKLRLPIKKISIAVIIIAVIAIAIADFAGSNGIVNITYNKTVMLNVNGSITFAVGGTGKTVLYLASSYNNISTFYISQYPVLENPVYTFTLTSGNTENISSTFSQNADLQIRLINSGSNSAQVEITKVPEGFSIRPSLINTLSQNATYQPTTTVPYASTSASTTTVKPINTSTTVLSDVNLSNIGKLMQNFGVLYRAGSSCTEQLYNTTLIQYKGIQPKGQFSYYNISMSTPTNVKITISKSTGSNYFVNYTVQLPRAQFSTPSVSVLYDSSSNSVMSTVFGGAYQGLNYTALNQEYQFQSGISNACAAYVT